MAEVQPEVRFMIYGGSGWLGGILQKLLTDQGKTFVLGTIRLQNRESLEKELDEHKPTHVLCARVSRGARTSIGAKATAPKPSAPT